MKYNDNGEYKDIYIKSFDTLPVGTEVDYDGETVPTGWTEVADPNTYSTDEVRIGTWIDGKPLYRKVVETTTPVVSTEGTLVNKSVSVGVSNVDFIYIDKAIIIGGGNYNANAVVSNMAFTYGVRFEVNPSNITIYGNSTTFSNLPAKVVVEYTKTTD